MTIIEAMIAVLIVAVLAAIAAPNLSELYVRNRLDTTANEFVTALNLARSEAIRRGTGVTVQRLAAGATLWDWTAGWQVRVTDSGEVLRVGQRISAPLTLYMAQVTEVDVRFTSTGRTEAISNYRAFVLCYENQIATASKQSRSRGIIIEPSGRVQLAATDTDGRPMKPPSSSKTAGQVAITSCTKP